MRLFRSCPLHPLTVSLAKFLSFLAMRVGKLSVTILDLLQVLRDRSCHRKVSSPDYASENCGEQHIVEWLASSPRYDLFRNVCFIFLVHFNSPLSANLSLA